MAKGYDRHQARQAGLSGLGRILARRSGSSCELCRSTGVSLAAVEVLPLPEEPEAENCVFICDECNHGVQGVAGALDHPRWSFLETAMWSEVPAVQVTAVRLLRRLAAAESRWARDALDNIYLDPEIEAWVER